MFRDSFKRYRAGLLTRAHVPEFDRPVHTTCYQEAIIFCEDKTVNVKLVPRQSEEFLASLCVTNNSVYRQVSILFGIELGVTGGDQFSVMTDRYHA